MKIAASVAAAPAALREAGCTAPNADANPERSSEATPEKAILILLPAQKAAAEVAARAVPAKAAATADPVTAPKKIDGLKRPPTRPLCGKQREMHPFERTSEGK